MQVFPGVYLVNGFPYGQHQNSYIIAAGKTLVMIDSGDLETGETFDLVRHRALAWGLRLEQVSHFLITHAHFDHSSHAARMQRLGARIVANQDAAEALAAGDDRCIGYAVHRVFEPCQVDLVVHDGDNLTVGPLAIHCLAAPGHANSCMVYEVVLQGQKLWFVGDILLVGLECRSVELGWNGGPDYDRPVYLETLRKLCHMECDCLFPGHGHPGIGNGKWLMEMAYTRAMMEWR